MSNLSTTLQSLLERKSMSPAELSRASGVAEPKISRWLNDTQTYISDDDLESLALQISTNSRERAELVVARLKDNLVGPGSEYVNITIAGAAQPATPREHARLPAELQEALPLFVANWKDPDVRNIIVGLKNLLAHGDCALSSTAADPADEAVSAAVQRAESPRRRPAKKK
jgi:transcriptional regulator with XRE-family HTH domain